MALASSVHGQTFTAVNVLEDYISPAAGLSVFARHNDYDLDHRLTQTTRPDAVVVDRSYDGAGRLDLLTMVLPHFVFGPGLGGPTQYGYP